MDRAIATAKINDIFQDVMDNDDLVISDAMTADDVEDWDSLAHVRLIVAIEQAFGIKFANAEVDSFKRVGDLIDAVQRRAA